MNSQEIFEFIDESVYDKKGERLNDLHRAVIEGILKHQKYEEIADEYGCSPGHAKDVGYELLQLLSETFGELVSKKNLRSVLIRKGRFNVLDNTLTKQTSVGDGNMVGYVNIFYNHTAVTQRANVLQQDSNQEHHIIQKLRKFGLSNQQISEALDLPVELIENITSLS